MHANMFNSIPDNVGERILALIIGGGCFLLVAGGVIGAVAVYLLK